MKISLSNLRQIIRESIESFYLDGQDVDNIEGFLLKQIKTGSSLDWSSRNVPRGNSVFEAIVDDDDGGPNGVKYIVDIRGPQSSAEGKRTFDLSLIVINGRIVNRSSSEGKSKENKVFSQSVSETMLPQLLRRIDVLFAESMKGRKFSGQ